MNQNKNFLVSVLCLTYNHASYIKETMDGFIMQKMTLPYVCVIVDDSSNDGTSEIIRSYLNENFEIDDKTSSLYNETDDYNLIFAQHKTNQFCFFAVYLLKYNHYSISKSKFPYLTNYYENAKYSAICEGDDYWTDCHKLADQTNILESHKNVVLVYSDHIVVNEKSEKILANKPKRPSGQCSKSLILRGNCIVTASVCFRREAISGWYKCKESIPFKLKMGDKPLWIYLSCKGDFYYLNKKQVAYRVLRQSASHFNDLNKSLEFVENGERIALYLNNYLKIGVEEKKIKQTYAYAKIRASLSYPSNDYLNIAKENILNYPKLLFNLKLILLIISRVVSNRPF